MIKKWKHFRQIKESNRYHLSIFIDKFKAAKERYDKIYINIDIIDDDTTEYGNLHIEYVTQNEEGWHLLSENFEELDNPYETYQELANVHGLKPFNILEKYDITDSVSDSDIQKKLSTDFFKLKEEDLFEVISELVDEGFYRKASYNFGFVSNGTIIYNSKTTNILSLLQSRLSGYKEFYVFELISNEKSEGYNGAVSLDNVLKIMNILKQANGYAKSNELTFKFRQTDKDLNIYFFEK